MPSVEKSNKWHFYLFWFCYSSRKSVVTKAKDIVDMRRYVDRSAKVWPKRLESRAEAPRGAKAQSLSLLNALNSKILNIYLLYSIK